MQIFDVCPSKSMTPCRYHLSENAVMTLRMALNTKSGEEYSDLLEKFMLERPEGHGYFLGFDEPDGSDKPGPLLWSMAANTGYMVVFDSDEDVLAVVSNDEIFYKDDFAANMQLAELAPTEENFNAVWWVFAHNLPSAVSLTQCVEDAIWTVRCKLQKTDLSSILRDVYNRLYDTSRIDDTGDTHRKDRQQGCGKDVML